MGSLKKCLLSRVFRVFRLLLLLLFFFQLENLSSISDFISILMSSFWLLLGCSYSMDGPRRQKQNTNGWRPLHIMRPLYTLSLYIPIFSCFIFGDSCCVTADSNALDRLFISAIDNQINWLVHQCDRWSRNIYILLYIYIFRFHCSLRTQ